MLKASMRRVGIVLTLAGVLALALPAPGSAAPLRSRQQTSFWGAALDWLAEELGLGPQGGHLSPGGGVISLQGKLGMGIDPDGKPSSLLPGTSATSSGTTNGDKGAGIDPDGSV